MQVLQDSWGVNYWGVSFGKFERDFIVLKVEINIFYSSLFCFCLCFLFGVFLGVFRFLVCDLGGGFIYIGFFNERQGGCLGLGWGFFFLEVVFLIRGRFRVLGLELVFVFIDLKFYMFEFFFGCFRYLYFLYWRGLYFFIVKIFMFF